ncbi:membrane progestin receptor delta isoform X1 [Periophthalmus magnuspinnatus]|uniref:membrane progestin receptor delta isoform X1 n=1 Tax=Periophthalmus magnuspinnatus TaxID=409849 RepID=UPI00145ACB2A|nr:membrane progestin receptor delta isoform X1 [Periophthalmus magnuspinnatus]
MDKQGSVLAVGKCLACLEFMLFPVWRGIWARGGSSGGWTETWERCLRWDSPAARRGVGPIWLVLCRGGRATLTQVCERGRGAIGLPSHLRVLPPLFNIHQVPKVVQEDSIMSGYRDPYSTALDCVLSSFQIHNETINIWTHFLPTWYFVWRLAVLCSCLDFGSDPYCWPLLVYMLLICVYPFTSSCAHTFSAMSTETYHICFFFDYGALSLYSLGCAISYGHYVMPECWVNSGLQRWFVPVALLNSLFCTSLSCYSRFVELWDPQRSKVLRTAAFVVPFIFDTMPLFYRIVLCCGGGCTHTQALSSHCYHLVFAFLTCFLFTSHLPERLAPGRFDYFGHSHQLFHVSAVVGTHFQMEGVLADMLSRRSWLLDHGGPPSFLWTIGALLMGLVLNLLIIGLFSGLLLWKRSGHFPLFFKKTVKD